MILSTHSIFGNCFELSDIKVQPMWRHSFMQQFGGYVMCIITLIVLIFHLFLPLISAFCLWPRSLSLSLCMSVSLSFLFLFSLFVSLLLIAIAMFLFLYSSLSLLPFFWYHLFLFLLLYVCFSLCFSFFVICFLFVSVYFCFSFCLFLC